MKKFMKEAVTENIYRLPLVLEPQPEGGWTITCPILRGLVTEADTIDEILPNVTDALKCLIEGYRTLNQPLPKVLQPIDASEPLCMEMITGAKKYASYN